MLSNFIPSFFFGEKLEINLKVLNNGNFATLALKITNYFDDAIKRSEALEHLNCEIQVPAS